MEFTAKQIAQFIQGKIEGDENAAVHTFAKIEEGVPGSISFLANEKYVHYKTSDLPNIVAVYTVMDCSQFSVATEMSEKKGEAEIERQKLNAKIEYLAMMGGIELYE